MEPKPKPESSTSLTSLYVSYNHPDTGCPSDGRTFLVQRSLTGTVLGISEEKLFSVTEGNAIISKAIEQAPQTTNCGSCNIAMTKSGAFTTSGQSISY